MKLSWMNLKITGCGFGVAKLNVSDAVEIGLWGFFILVERTV